MSVYKVKVPLLFEIRVSEEEVKKSGGPKVIFDNFFKEVEEDQGAYGIFFELRGFDVVSYDVADKMFNHGKVVFSPGNHLDFTRHGCYEEDGMSIFSFEAIYSFGVEGEMSDLDFNTVLKEVNDTLQSPEEIECMKNEAPFQLVTENEEGSFRKFEIILGRPWSIDKVE